MVSRNNRQLIEAQNRNERQRFTLRKLNVGVVSVLVGVAFTVYGGGELVAHADTLTAPTPVEQAGPTSPAGNQVTLKSPAAPSAAPQSQAPTSEHPARETVVSGAPVSEGANSIATSATSAVEASAAQDSIQPAGADRATSQAAPLVHPAVLATSSATPTNQSEVTVTTAQDFYNAVVNGTATVINVGANINLNEISRNNKPGTLQLVRSITNRRNITIQSTAGNRYTIDFGTYTFNMGGSDYSATFSNLDIYGQSWFGLVESPAALNFNNITYHGSQLVYSERATAVNFSGDNNIQTVNSYVSPLDGQTYYPNGTTTTTNNQQQVIQLTRNNSSVTFKTGTNTVLQTISGNVVEMNAGNVAMTVEDGANVTLNPHTGNKVEDGIASWGGVAHGIATNGATTLTVGQGAHLTINVEKTGNDVAVSNGIYLYGGANVNVAGGGTVVVNVNGTPSISSIGGAAPVYMSNNSNITVGNQGVFKINATNLGSYAGPLMRINGSGNVSLQAHSIFSITGDGTGALTGIQLGSGTFSSDQPDEFNVDLSQNTNAQKKLITNGTINFTRVKEKFNDGSFSGPMKQIVVKYNASGVPTVSTIVGATTAASDQVKNAITTPGANYLYFTLAGQDVTINVPTVNLSPSGQLSGTVAVAGGDNANVYVSITITMPNGTTITVPANASLTKPYENDPTNYQTVTDGTGAFTVDLSQYNLTDPANAGAVIHILAAKDFINATADVPVATLQNKIDKSALQAAVDDQKAVHAKPEYYNAPQKDQDTYDQAVTAGQAVLDNPSATATDVTNALNAINKAKAALNGQATDPAALQAAVDAKGSTQGTPKYYNATPEQQQAYDDAVTTGQNVLDNPSATQAQVDAAVKKINDAKDALGGTATDTTALKAAVVEQPTVQNTPKYYNATPEQQQAYDEAVAAGQNVLDNSSATQAQVDAAVKKINDAKDALSGQATDPAALQAAVDAKGTTHGTPKYYNATPEQQQAYDDAVTAGQNVLDNSSATQAQVDAAVKKINDAKAALSGEATNKSDLQTAVDAKGATQGTPKYYNATPEQQQAYDDAVTAGQNVLDNPSATQAQVDAAVKKINDAKDALGGTSTDTTALKVAVAEQPTVQNTPKYYNATPEQQQAYDDAVTAGQDVLKNPNAPQAQVDAAVKKINDAKNALGGTSTDTTALKAAVAEQPTVQNTPKYYNATPEQQQAYDDAVTAGQDVLKNPNAPQAQVDAAVKKINDAKNALSGQATNTDILKTAVNYQDTVKISPAYVNADPDLQAKYDQAIATGSQVLKNPLAPQAEVDRAAAEITAAQNALNGAANLQAGKEAADQAIEKSLADKKDEINSSNLTDEEKKSLIAQANQAASEAKDNVAKVTTNQEVADASKTGVDQINGITVPSTSPAKDEADQAIEKALEDKTNEINSSNLTKEEKQDLIDQATKDANNAKDNVDKATTDREVTDVSNAGVNQINGIQVPTTSPTKDAADKAIDQALAEKTTEINSSNLTKEEKQDLIDQATKDANNAKDNVDKATTNQEVTSASEAGENQINGIQVPTTSPAKDAADQAIEKALENKTNEINSSNLTKEEKQALIDQATNDANNAKDNVDKATTNQEVTAASKTGVDQINGIVVPTTSPAKDAADQAIEKALADKTSEINSSNLTKEEKQALIDQATKDANNAKANVDKATTNQEVTNASDAGVTQINGIQVPTSSQAKGAADQVIEKALADKTDEINSSNLTKEEKQDLIDQATKDANNAKDNVDKATTNQEVTEVSNTGVNQINGITVPTTSPAKDAADQAIEKALENKTNEINSSNLTKEEKQDLIDQAAKDANNAKTNVDKATTDQEVTSASKTGVDQINGIVVPTSSQAKDAADQAIEKALENKTSEINSSNLTKEEKQALIDQATNDANNAKANVDKATTNQEVTNASDAGVTQINGIVVPTTSPAKDAADQAIEKALADKTDEINSSNLTKEEKQDLIDQATKDANNAKANVDKATTNQEVTEVSSTGVNQINGITVPTTSPAKDAADQAIEKALEDKTDEINSSNLTKEEKESLIAQANQAASEAKDNVAKATTNQEVTDVSNAGVEQINGITVPKSSAVKDAADQAIDKALADKTNEINSSNLTKEEKQALIDQATKDATEAKDKIAAATTNQEVTDASDAGVAQINGITVPKSSALKDAADKAIDQALAEKTTEINSSNLTDEEKKALIGRANQDAKKAKDKIAAATTNQEVTDASNTGVAQINGITVPESSALKDAADKEIDKALADKTAEINAAPNLTEEEKQALVNQANQAAKDAKRKIAEATTNQQVTAASNTGVAQIKGIQIPVNPGTPLPPKGDSNETGTGTEEQGSHATPEVNDQGQSAPTGDGQIGVSQPGSQSQIGAQKPASEDLTPVKRARLAERLPQTGNDQHAGSGLIGLVLAEVAGALGLAKLDRKRKEDR